MDVSNLKTLSAVWDFVEHRAWRTAWLSVLGAGHGACGNVSGLVTLEMVGLRRQAVGVSLNTMFAGVATLLVGLMAGARLSCFQA